MKRIAYADPPGEFPASALPDDRDCLSFCVPAFRARQSNAWPFADRHLSLPSPDAASSPGSPPHSKPATSLNLESWWGRRGGRLHEHEVRLPAAAQGYAAALFAETPPLPPSLGPRRFQ